METKQNTPHHCYTVGEHILKSLTEIENDRLLRITMLLHDIAKPVVKKTDENGRAHFKPHGPAGEKLAGKILYLNVQRADLLSQRMNNRDEKLARLNGVTETYQEILKRGECTSLKTLAVTGKDLINAGHPAGPELGDLLEKLLDSVLKDPSLNTKEKLLEAAEKDSIKTE